MAATVRSRPPRADLVAAPLFSFVVLGLPDGMLGVAWPVLRHGFGQPLAGLGELLIASLCGYLAVSSTTGWALRRFGTVAVLLGSAVAGCAGAGLFAVTRWWAVLVAAAVLLGAAGGGLDAALNTVIALAGRARMMNLLHAAYGVGAALGPLVVTAAVAAASWRAAYGVLFALEVILAAVWVGLRRAFSPAFSAVPRRPPQADGSRRRPWKRATGPRVPPFRMLLIISLAVFFFYTGLEVAVASWAASYLRGPGGLSTALSGLAVFAYWIGLTAGRMGAAGLGTRLSAENAARAGVAGGIAGSAVVWANIAPAVTVAGLVIIGLSLGPIFPALVTLTPGRLGESTAVTAIGWQMAAASAGGTSLSALTGVVLQLTGLATFGPVLVLLAVALGCLILLVERAAAAGAPRAGTPE
jgi:fucose permease